MLNFQNFLLSVFKVSNKIIFAQDLKALAILCSHVGDRLGGIARVTGAGCPAPGKLTHFVASAGPSHWCGAAAEPAAFPPVPGPSLASLTYEPSARLAL